MKQETVMDVYIYQHIPTAANKRVKLAVKP